ncbi:MAG: hypothetical protein QXI11_06690 [Thermoproteota archaeon]
MSDLNRILEYVRSVEDWRGLIAFTFTLGFFIVFAFEIMVKDGFEGVKLLMPPVMLILGFYFGEKSAG